MNIIHTLDITKDNCPVTFVKVKLYLEKLEKGEKLEIYLKSGEPLENVPKTLKEHGYKILNIINEYENVYKILVEK
jgi:tRNA 2-thiouridine synthesizing protein A